MKQVIRRFLAIGLGILVLGCAGVRPSLQLPEKRPLGKQYIDSLEETPSPKNIVADSGNVLTLPMALQLALLRNPALQGVAYEIRIREAQALQASFLPNPEIDIEMENIGGQSELAGIKAAETTLQIGQIIEMAGKRQKRTRIAELEGTLAGWDFEARRMDVYLQTVKAYIEVVAAQERLKLTLELQGLAEQFLKNIQDRIKKGKDSPAEAARAEVELANARVAVQAAEKALQSARQRLAAMWGDTDLKFQRVAGRLDSLPKVPELASLLDFVVQTPEIARWAVAMQLAEAQLALEKARRIPDPTISAGVRRLNEVESNAFVFGVSFPLPLFNRNQGNIRAAMLKQQQIAYFQQAALLEVQTRLQTAYHRLAALKSEIAILQEQALPRAEEAFLVVRKGYMQGRYGFLEVLDAQRTLFDVRSRYIEVLSQFHQQVAEIERLIAQPINGAF